MVFFSLFLAANTVAIFVVTFFFFSKSDLNYERSIYLVQSYTFEQ